MFLRRLASPDPGVDDREVGGLTDWPVRGWSCRSNSRGALSRRTNGCGMTGDGAGAAATPGSRDADRVRLFSLSRISDPGGSSHPGISGS